MQTFSSQRTRILRDAEKQASITGKPFTATTRPYKSTVQIVWDVVDPLPTGPGNARIAYAVARKNQRIELFSYAVGDAIPYGVPGQTKIATEADTNVSKGRRTNGVERMIIESISATNKDLRVAYPANTYTGLDNDVLGAHSGQIIVLDPGSLVCPPQVESPFNLENPFWEALKPVLQVEFEWDRGRVIKIGTLDEIPEGGAKSLLKASGIPDTKNRYKVPEGYVWDRQGEPDSEFIVRLTVADTVVIPISLVTLNGQTSIFSVPTNVYTDVTMRLHGLAVSLPSQN